MVNGSRGTFCFDGFDNAAASILDILGVFGGSLQGVLSVTGAHLEHARKKLITTSKQKNEEK